MSDGELRNAYAQHYQQPAAYVDTYKQKIAGMDINALAQYAAAEDKKKIAWAAQTENRRIYYH